MLAVWRFSPTEYLDETTGASPGCLLGSLGVVPRVQTAVHIPNHSSRAVFGSPVFLCAGGCAPQPEPSQGETAQPETARSVARGDSNISDAATLSLRVNVVIPARAAVGAEIPIKLVVSNTGGAKIAISQIAPPPVYDVDVARPDGDIVWRRLPPDQVLLLAADQYTLAPGATRELETVSWDQKDLRGRQVEPGRYRIQGVFYGGVAGSGVSETRTPAVMLSIGR
jgi:hypothetical protein